MSLTAGFDPTAGGSGLAGGVTDALNSAPDLINNPGLALDSGGSLDPTTFAPVVSHIQNVQSTLTALGDQTGDQKVLASGEYSGGSGGIFGAIAHTFQSIPGIKGAEHALGTVIHYASTPLREIQRDYRFVHLVWTKNGPVAGLLATLGVTAGAALGGYAGNAEGAALGAEAAGFGERLLASHFGGHGKGYTANGQTHYNEGLAETAALSADPHVKISIGRDWSNALSHVPGLSTLKNTDKGFGKVFSGVNDAAFDWSADPVVVAAKIKTGLKLGDYGTAAKAVAQTRVTASKAEAAASDSPWVSVRNAAQRVFSGDLLRSVQSDGVAKFMDKAAPGIKLTPGDSESLNNLYNATVGGASYRRALTHIAGLNTAEIINKYPDLQDLAANSLKAPGQDAIKGLGAAKTAEEAHQVLLNVVENAHLAERLKSLNVVPTRTLTRVLPSKLADVLANIDKNAATTESTVDGVSAITRANPRSSLVGGALTAIGKAGTGDLKGAKDAITGAAARKIDTFSRQLPYAADPETLKISGQEFKVDESTQQLAPYAAKGLFNMLKMSMGTQRARYWLGQFVNADSVAEQKRIFAEANFELLKATGLVADPSVVIAARREAADWAAGTLETPGGIGGGSQGFGFGKEFGSSVDEVPAGDGVIKSALHNYQASTTFKFADYSDVKRLQREQRNALVANYGRFDDMAAKHYFRNFFKPMALVNTGFGLRVALSEAIPQAIRVGAMKTLRDTVAAKAARMNYNLISDEPDHILAAAAHAMGAPRGAAHSLVNGINGLLNDPITRERAIGRVIAHGGHLAHGLSATGEDTGGGLFDPAGPERAQQALHYTKSYMKNQPQLKWRGTKDFDYFTTDSANYDGYWHAGLVHSAQDPAVRLKAQDLLSGGPEFARVQEEKRIQDALDKSPDAIPFYLSEKNRLRGYSNIEARNTLPDGTPWDAKAFAARRVDAVRGLTEGKDDTVHNFILEALAKGRAPELKDLAAIEKESRPAQVFGSVAAPYLGNNIMQRIINFGFAHMVDPVISGLSRDPQYLNAFSEQMDHFEGAIKSGHLDQDTAERIAETRAVVGMLPKIHNTTIRTQFATLARNYMPFYFAQEQALRRVGKLIVTHPAALRQYQLVNQGLNDPGFVQKDDQGNRFFVYPHIGALQDVTNGLLKLGTFGGGDVQTGLPLTVQGNMSSLKTLLPDFNMPGVSPLVSIPLNKLTGMFPELSPEVKAITGGAGFNQSAFDALVPNTFAKAAWRVMNADEKDSTYANAVFTSMMSAIHNGKWPGPDASPQARAEWINRIKNNARSTFMVKALVGLVSPLAPRVSNASEAELGFRTEFFNLVKKDGYATALQTFLKEHGNSAISYTVAQSQPAVHGAYLPYTNEALKQINDPSWQALWKSKYGNAAAFLLPQAQGKGDVQAIHAEIVRNHLRTMDTPQGFLDAVDIALGNNAISPDLETHKNAQASLANDSKGLAAENANWSDYLKVQHLNNPVWYDYWASPQRQNLAYDTYEGLKALYEGRAKDSNGNLLKIPNTPQAGLVLDLLNDYTIHAQQMAGLTTAPQRNAERANWQAHLDEQAKNPLLYSVINAVFSRLDAAGLAPGPTRV